MKLSLKTGEAHTIRIGELRDGELEAFLGWIASPPAQLDGLLRWRALPTSGFSPSTPMKTATAAWPGRSPIDCSPP